LIKSFPEENEMKVNESSQTGRKVVGYIRVSTGRQAEFGHSIQTQKSRIASWVALWYDDVNLEIVEEVASASGGKRPKLSRIESEIRRRRVCCIVAISFDRLWRSTADCCKWLALCERYDCRVCVVEMGIDTRTPFGKLIAKQHAIISEYEAEETGKRTRMVHAEQRRKGFRGPGHRPFGWKVGTDKKLIPDEREQRVILYVASERANGTSWGRIAEQLNELGHRTVKDHEWTGPGLRIVYNSASARIREEGSIDKASGSSSIEKCTGDAPGMHTHM
jgi:DNA invertase Pin-like site-specific DNA recombinase